MMKKGTFSIEGFLARQRASMVDRLRFKIDKNDSNFGKVNLINYNET